MKRWLANRKLTVVGRFAVLVLLIDVVVAGVMIAILRDPIAVFGTFAILNVTSLVLLRGKTLTEP